MSGIVVHSDRYVADPDKPRWLLPCCAKLVNEDGWRALGLGDPPPASGPAHPRYKTYPLDGAS